MAVPKCSGTLIDVDLRTHIIRKTMKRHMTAGIILTAFLSLALGACSTQTATEEGGIAVRPIGVSSLTYLSGSEPDTSIIAIGDSIRFSVWGYPEFSTRAIVKLTGTITVPLIGEQFGAGLKADELIQHLRKRLAEYVKGEVKISLEVEHPSPRITVLGSVARPGSFVAKADLPLLEVLATVGGWTELADLRFVRINRQASSQTDAGSLEINLALIMDRGNTRMIPMIRPGDVVIVPKAENFVRQLSEFLRDGLLLLSVFRIFN